MKISFGCGDLGTCLVAQSQSRVALLRGRELSFHQGGNPRPGALRLKMLRPCLEVALERRICGHIPAVQPATVAPKRRVLEKPTQQGDGQGSFELADEWVLFQSAQIACQPGSEIALPGLFIPLRDLLGVRLEVRCEPLCLENARGRTFPPAIRKPMQHEQRRQLAQALFEPVVLVFPVAVEIGHDMAQLVRELVHVLAPVCVPGADSHLVWSVAVEDSRRFVPPGDLNWGIRRPAEGLHEHLVRGLQDRLNGSKARTSPVAVLYRQSFLFHHSAPLTLGDADRAPWGPRSRGPSMLRKSIMSWQT